MAITPIYFTYEDTTGDVLGPFRIHAVDKIAAERTARSQGWPFEDTPRIHALMGYHAARRTGNPCTSFTDFMETLVDFELTNSLPETSQDDEDPTKADI